MLRQAGKAFGRLARAEGPALVREWEAALGARWLAAGACTGPDTPCLPLQLSKSNGALWGHEARLLRCDMRVGGLPAGANPNPNRRGHRAAVCGSCGSRPELSGWCSGSAASRRCLPPPQPGTFSCCSGGVSAAAV